MHTFNKYGIFPGANVAEPKLKEIDSKNDIYNNAEASTASIKQITWSNPDMEDEFI